MKLVFISIIVLLIFSILFFNVCESFESNADSGLNRIDAIIYINLDHRKDRKKQITNELKKMGVKPEKIIRFPAVFEKYNGHLGCCKSHIGVLELIKKSNFKNCLILEDDFKFKLSKEETNNKIDTFLNKYGDTFDAIHLSVGHWEKKGPVKDGVCRIDYCTTSSGYLLNNHSNFYDELLNDLKNARNKMTKESAEYQKKNPNKKQTITSNALNQHWFGLQKRANWYAFEPQIGVQEGSTSSIMSNVSHDEKMMK